MKKWFILLLAVTISRCDDDECPEFECPAIDGSFADPCTCRRFYQCNGYNAHVSNCPSGLYWDDIKKYCTYKNEAVCGPVVTTPAPSTTEHPDKAEKCDTSACELPYCHCSSDGTQIPGGLERDKIPQMVMIMLDGAINDNNFLSYSRLFRDRKNPNGCNIKGTFFLTHHYSNYQQIQELNEDGHEFAISSITDDANLAEKNSTAWTNELVGMRTILLDQADIYDEVLGSRAPGLRPGYSTQYEVMVDYGFIWDSSIGAPPLKVPVWPYTLDYKIPHDCKSDSCPTRSFPGLWELPLNSHYVEGYAAGHCPYIDQCVFSHMDSGDIFDWLKEDFQRHYSSNKAPYALAMHTNWFTNKEQVTALEKFMNYTETLDDVYYVTATQALLWMTDPVQTKDIRTYESWQCTQDDRPKACGNANKCALEHRQDDGIKVVKYMTTCQECPSLYPWLGNAKGRDTDKKDVYEKYEE